MIDISVIRKIAATTTGAAISFAVMLANPAQAAIFSFYSLGGASLFNGFGQLSFDDTSLTGAENELVSLSQLVDSQFFFNFTQSVPAIATGFTPIYSFSNNDVLGDPTFSFQSGTLTGINFQTRSVPFTYGLRLDPFTFITANGTASLQAAGTQVITSEQGVGTTFDFSTNPPRTFSGQFSQSLNNQISIQTIQPWVPPRSVPEPGSAFGLGLLGIGFLLKKKLGYAKSA